MQDVSKQARGAKSVTSSATQTITAWVCPSCFARSNGLLVSLSRQLIGQRLLQYDSCDINVFLTYIV